MHLDLNEIQPESIKIENNKFADIIESVDDVTLSNSQIECSATVTTVLERESGDESIEIAFFIDFVISAEDLECDGDSVYASGLHASSDYEIYEESNYSEEELQEVKTYIEKYFVGQSSATTYSIEAAFSEDDW